MTIKRFLHKSLEDFFYDGTTKGINPKQFDCLATRLDRLDAATQPGDMRLPGYNFHKLNPKTANRYSIHVNGPWCITFEFDNNGNATNVNYEQYH